MNTTTTYLELRNEYRLALYFAQNAKAGYALSKQRGDNRAAVREARDEMEQTAAVAAEALAAYNAAKEG